MKSKVFLILPIFVLLLGSINSNSEFYKNDMTEYNNLNNKDEEIRISFNDSIYCYFKEVENIKSSIDSTEEIINTNLRYKKNLKNKSKKLEEKIHILINDITESIEQKVEKVNRDVDNDSICIIYYSNK